MIQGRELCRTVLSWGWGYQKVLSECNRGDIIACSGRQQAKGWMQAPLWTVKADNAHLACRATLWHAQLAKW